jgi:hypothetical protein
VTLEPLLDANPQITNVLKISDAALIHLPSHIGHHTASPSGDRAILQPEETLDHLAWRCGVTLHALLRQNPGVRDLSLLEPGLVLLVPTRSEPVRQAPVQWARTEADLITVGWKPDPSQPTDQASARAKRACLDKVSRETGQSNVTVLSSEFSEANSVVMVGVGNDRAPWRCLVSNDGVVAEIMFAGKEGGSSWESGAVQLPERIPVGTPSQDAKVPGTNFNATGNIPCARYPGQPMMQCKFGVIRKGNGNGSVTVFWPDGGNRVIYFEDATPMSYDESEADGGAKMTVGKSSDLHTVKIGDQRFEIPDAVITGG